MTEKKTESKEIVLIPGSPEDIICGLTAMDKRILTLPHYSFSLSMKNDDLMFEINDEMAIKLYNYDLTDRSTRKISYIDLILSEHDDDAFETVEDSASSLILSAYNEIDLNCQFNLMCNICYSYYLAKFRDIKSTKDVDRPIPTRLFLSLLDKEKGELEISYTDLEGNLFAGTLDFMAIRSNPFSVYIQLRMNIISKGKDGYTEGFASFRLPYVKNVQNVEELGIKLITPELKEELTERGKKYIKYTQKPAYCFANGFAHIPGGWFGDRRTSINGRVMIDINAMRTLNPYVDDDWYKGNPFNNNFVADDVKEERLWMCSPVVFGFSFGNKDWLRMSINSLSDIQFSDTAFNELIVPKRYKDIFTACLLNDIPSLDSIEGKGNGKIFLLYGPPGCGKTLSAESVAEHERKPLYYVSVGELGTSPSEMEERLGKIMTIAKSWDAIVLLDEVDVFAVKRENADIERTAMTAILLRLLERYDGIMFMTTNLIDNLDAAFISRATACIPYKALEDTDRRTIWLSLLKKVEKHGMQIHNEVYDGINTLAEHDVNGREIKNLIRLAYSLALNSDEKHITIDMLNDVIALKRIG